MEINYTNRKTQKTFSSVKELRGKFGQRADIIQRRIDQLETSETLESFRQDFQGLRIHEYQGNEKGKFSINITGNLRLIFRPTVPFPFKPDGGLDWKQITSIVVLEVIDPH